MDRRARAAGRLLAVAVAIAASLPSGAEANQWYCAGCGDSCEAGTEWRGRYCARSCHHSKSKICLFCPAGKSNNKKEGECKNCAPVLTLGISFARRVKKRTQVLPRVKLFGARSCPLETKSITKQLICRECRHDIPEISFSIHLLFKVTFLKIHFLKIHFLKVHFLKIVWVPTFREG